MNQHQIPIPEKHVPHFEVLQQIRALQSQCNDFTLHTVYPFDTISYLLSDVVSVRVELANEIDKELFEAWLEDMGAPDDLQVVIDLVGTKQIPHAWQDGFELGEDEYYDGE